MKQINFKELGELIMNCVCSYPYGSRVYGTHSENSDFDFILIFEDDFAKNLDDQYLYYKERYLSPGQFLEENYSIYSRSKFQSMLDEHHISALECFFLPEPDLSFVKFNFKLNLDKLRKSISEKVSHSWVKAKKKFEIESDRNIYVGKKSLFHSFRIIDFGMQIGKNGKIDDYQSCVGLWNEIKNNPSQNWKDYEILYKESHNKWMSEFRKFALKGN